jgi:7-cyano-7-deazaguanine synthase
MEKRAFVLLSGGIDSTTCMYQAATEYPAVTAVSIDYGQRHKKEIEAARKITDMLDIEHIVLKLESVMSDVMLTDPNVALPNVSYAQLGHGMSPTYVPFRNGTLLSLITAIAQKYVMAQIEELVNDHTNLGVMSPSRADVTARARDLCGVYFGAHSEDAHNWAYPDCTPEFIGAMANAIYVGTYSTVRLITPLQWLTKADIIVWANELGVPFDMTRSCYSEDEMHCGTCPTCQARRAAFAETGIHDPTRYQRDIERNDAA